MQALLNDESPANRWHMRSLINRAAVTSCRGSKRRNIPGKRERNDPIEARSCALIEFHPLDVSIQFPSYLVRRLNWRSRLLDFHRFPIEDLFAKERSLRFLYIGDRSRNYEGSDRETTLEIFIIRPFIAAPLHFWNRLNDSRECHRVFYRQADFYKLQEKKKDRFASLSCHDLIDRFVRSFLLGWRLRYVVYSLCTLSMD